MTNHDLGRLATSAESAGAPGVRVVIDVRPLQEPERAPTTAVYLAELLAAFNAQPVDGESFAFMLQAGLDDPTTGLDSLEVIGRRLLPPTRLLRSGALTVDPFLLRGASLGVAWQAERGGAAGAVYHAAAGAAPLASGIPVVVTVLDLAPWELPNTFQATFAARFGQRLRARILRDAAAVIVGSPATGQAVRRFLHVRRDRIRVVPLAARAAFQPSARKRAAAQITKLGLPERYLVYPGRYDVRQDLTTLLRALATLQSSGPPDELPAGAPWPPRVVLVGASPDDRAALARAANREGVGDLIAYTPYLDPARLAAVIAGARAAVLPVVSDAAGLTAIEALACGTPVVASAVGALSDLVAGAGILVEPRGPDRLAVALTAAWSDGDVQRSIAGAARERATATRRTWADVARETRAVYASVAGPGRF